MQFTNIKQKVGKLVVENSTVLLTAGGVVGSVATALLAARGGYKYATINIEKKNEIYIKQFEGLEDPDVPTIKWNDIQISKKGVLLAAAPHIIPPVLIGGVTVVSIIMAHKLSAQKIAALAAAYGLAERNFGDYKAKVEEKLTGPKKTAIDDELAHEAIVKTPGSDKVVFVEGEVLCLDKPTGRYFNSTMESIKQAVNTTNSEVFNHGHARASFFYEELGLNDNVWADELGFTPEHLLELTYTTDMAPGNRPCIVIDFARLPKADYHPKYD